MLIPAAGVAQKKPIEAEELARIRTEESRRVRLATNRMQALRPDLGLSNAHTLELRSAMTDLYGRTHARYQQFYQGVRVMGGGAIAHVDEQDRFEQPTTKLFPDILIDVVPAVDAATARAAIVQEAGPGSVDSSVVLRLVIVPVRTLVFTQDLGKRVLLDVPAMEEYQWQTTGYRLAWFGLSSTESGPEDDREPGGWLVDATSGMVIRRWSQRVNDEFRAVQGSAQSLFYGPVEINSSQNLQTQEFELTDATRGGNSTRNLENKASYSSVSAVPYRNSSNVWGDGKLYDAANGSASANGQTAALDVAFGVERTWDTLANVFAQPGLDGKGASIDTRVHFGKNQEAAFWLKTSKAAFFGDGAASSTATPTDLETVAHELGHGMWFSLIESEGFDGGEAAGVSEGHGDIVASLVEFYYLGAKGRGTVLTDVEAAWNWRPRMVDPARVGGLREWDSTARGRAEHSVGTIYGRLFVLLSRGAPADRANPTYSRFFPNGMAGLGLQEAGRVWYAATAGYLPDEPNFFELRTAFLQAAEYLYGAESTGVRITQNAFAAVGLGAPAVDAAPPTINAVTLSDMDEGEGSMLVSATATDDTGVLSIDFQIDGQTVLSRTKAPYAGYVSIAKLAPGTHIVMARALDYSAKAGISSATFGTKGVNQLIADGGFEEGGKWLATPGVVQSAGVPFLGSRHAAFAATASIWQKVQISETATSANLSFRLRVESSSLAVGDRLEVQIRNEQGAVVETLATIYDGAATTDSLAKDYSKRSFNLMAYRGKTVELRFTSTIVAAGTVKFRVDNVSLVSDEPLSAVAEADADNGERSVIFRIRSLSGVTSGQVSRVDYSVNGELVASSRTSPYVVVLPTQSFPARTHTMTAIVYGPSGDKLVEPAAVSFTVASVEQLIVNGGFESGGTGWVTTGQTIFGRDMGTTMRAFMGFRYAQMAGLGTSHADEIFQRFTVPEGSTSATLTFRLRIDTQETTANDVLTVRLLDDRGGRLTDIGVFTSLVNTYGPGSALGYIKPSFDLTPYIGRVVQIQFQGRENSGRPTSFIIDNVSATYK